MQQAQQQQQTILEEASITSDLTNTDTLQAQQGGLSRQVGGSLEVSEEQAAEDVGGADTGDLLEGLLNQAVEEGANTDLLDDGQEQPAVVPAQDPSAYLGGAQQLHQQQQMWHQQQAAAAQQGGAFAGGGWGGGMMMMGGGAGQMPMLGGQAGIAQMQQAQQQQQQLMGHQQQQMLQQQQLMGQQQMMGGQQQQPMMGQPQQPMMGQPQPLMGYQQYAQPYPNNALQYGAPPSNYDMYGGGGGQGATNLNQYLQGGGGPGGSGGFVAGIPVLHQLTTPRDPTQRLSGIDINTARTRASPESASVNQAPSPQQML
jgi:hypothetical protein